MLHILFAAAALPLAVKAVDVDDNKFSQHSGLLRYPIRNVEGAPAVKNITKRQDDVGLSTQLMGNFYSIDLTFGTPGQVVSVNLDTGSDELWVNPNCNNAYDPDFCATFPRFTQSSTLVDLEEQATITYGSGSADINYVYDYVSVGDARINQQIFGVASDSEFWPVGILGMGPALTGWDSPYPRVVDSLAEQGFTNSRAFSLDIRSLESDRGSVVFGGIDTKKYSGPLEKRPIVPAAESPDGYTRFWVYFDGITITQADGSQDVVFSQVNGQVANLDSGYTLSAMPSEIFNGILDAFPSARPVSGSTTYEVDCDIADTEGSVDVTFGEVVINIPFSDFIYRQSEASCVLGVFLDDEMPVFGDTFLRAAYVVYDWDNRNVHIANNEDCGSNLVPIGTGPDSVPSLVGECSGSKPTTTTSAAPSTTTSAPPDTTSEPVTTTTVSPSTTGHGGNHTTFTTGWHNTTTTSSRPHTTLHPTTSTLTSTKTYTITSCPPTVTNCPIGSTTTEVITQTTAVCPETTGTYTIPHTYTCTKAPHCHPGDVITTTKVVTVVPITTKDKPTDVPGCSSCAPPAPNPTYEPTGAPPAGPPPPLTTVTGPQGPGGNATATTPPAIPTAGAAEWKVPGMAALAMGVLAVAAL